MKLQKALLLCVPALAFAASAFAQTPAKPANTAPKAPAAPAASLPTRAVLDTSMGRITCEFFPKQAPLAVANFIGLSKGVKTWVDPVSGTAQHNKPYYNGTIFHRVIPGFMAQGGDPTGTGTGNPGYMFVDEFDPSLNFDVPGRLAMANSGPNTNGSQFFITEQPYASLNQHYTIFGQCTDASVLVVKAITGVPRDDRDKPLTPVVLKKVTIVRPGQPLPPLPGAATAHPAAHTAAKPATKP
ncbi:MAG: peptidylprolyl isomerase [Terracidiphilus sp.]|jgi:peptidyl-prolyl cis-trans isomerase A (cyclophilin A)